MTIQVPLNLMYTAICCSNRCLEEDGTGYGDYSNNDNVLTNEEAWYRTSSSPNLYFYAKYGPTIFISSLQSAPYMMCLCMLYTCNVATMYAFFIGVNLLI